MLTDLHRYLLGLDEAAAPAEPVELVTILPSARNFAERLLSLPLCPAGGPALGIRHGHRIDVAYFLRGGQPWRSNHALQFDPAYVLGGVDALVQTDAPALDWVGYWVADSSCNVQQQAQRFRLVDITRPFITLSHSPEMPIIRAFGGEDRGEITCQ